MVNIHPTFLCVNRIIGMNFKQAVSVIFIAFCQIYLVQKTWNGNDSTSALVCLNLSFEVRILKFRSSTLRLTDGKSSFAYYSKPNGHCLDDVHRDRKKHYIVYIDENWPKTRTTCMSNGQWAKLHHYCALNPSPGVYAVFQAQARTSQSESGINKPLHLALRYQKTSNNRMVIEVLPTSFSLSRVPFHGPVHS